MLGRKWQNEADGFKSFMSAAAKMLSSEYSPAETNV
jgi:hypothetical protein